MINGTVSPNPPYRCLIGFGTAIGQILVRWATTRSYGTWSLVTAMWAMISGHKQGFGSAAWPPHEVFTTARSSLSYGPSYSANPSEGAPHTANSRADSCHGWHCPECKVLDWALSIVYHYVLHAVCHYSMPVNDEFMHMYIIYLDIYSCVCALLQNNKLEDSRFRCKVWQKHYTSGHQ